MKHYPYKLVIIALSIVVVYVIFIIGFGVVMQKITLPKHAIKPLKKIEKYACITNDRWRYEFHGFTDDGKYTTVKC